MCLLVKLKYQPIIRKPPLKPGCGSAALGCSRIFLYAYFAPLAAPMNAARDSLGFTIF